MRILHTSDWHLGISTGPASRSQEQQSFLDWLLETLATREVDVLVVAGDVFDSMHPPAEALELYYGFLARVEQSGVRDVVIVGGNHDSPSRLDAPRALLRAVNAHVVGGVPSPELRAERMIAPLRARGHEEPVALCLAVPYVHEYRLGVRTTDLDRDQTRESFKAAFQELYASLAEAARARYGDLPLVATGHLTLGTGSRREDYPQEIHQVGTIEGLPLDVLDPRIRYAALGHIHRSYRVGDSSAWYSGSPIPYSLSEMNAARRVLLVELDGAGEAKVEPLEVPLERELVQLVGTSEAVLEELRALEWSTPLPPLVHVRVEANFAEPGLARRLHEAVAAQDEARRPVLVEVQQRATGTEGESCAPLGPSLEDLQPAQVFELLCDAKRLVGEEREQLVEAFQQLSALDAETLDARLSEIELPPSERGGRS